MNHIMDQLEIFKIPRPCRGVCETDNRGYCKGCFLRRDERLNWLKMTDTEKRHLLYLCTLRKRKLQLLAWQTALEERKNKFAATPEQTEQIEFDF